MALFAYNLCRGFMESLLQYGSQGDRCSDRKSADAEKLQHKSFSVAIVVNELNHTHILVSPLDTYSYR
jgi:hypothetical protein